MDISPGTEFVWRLAASEAIATRRENIEPDHFFCALLKFSEVGAKELGVAAAHQLAQTLKPEGDRVRAALEGRSLPTTRIRRQLRRALGRGGYQHKGDVVHRSTASRLLFSRAARVALKDKGVLEAHHLLQVLLEEPTAAMVQVMKDVGPTTGLAESPFLSPYAQDVSALRQAGKPMIPEIRKSQVQVMTEALQSSDPTPILLVCAPGIQLAPLVGHVAQAVKDQKRLLKIDHARVLRDAKEEGMLSTQMAKLLTEAAGAENLVLFMDSTEQGAKPSANLLSALGTALTSGTPRLLVAISAEVYRDVVEPDPTWDGAFRVVWLHSLTEGDVPDEL